MLTHNLRRSPSGRSGTGANTLISHAMAAQDRTISARHTRGRGEAERPSWLARRLPEGNCRLVPFKILIPG